MLKRLSIILAVLVILSLALTGAGMAAEDVQTSADAYFSGGTQNVKAADMFETLNDGDTSNDPYIIDLRKPEDYELAHVPGAVNLSVKKLFTPEGLASLPTDQPVVTYCYTGQTSSQATSALNMLGYETKSMLYGFPTWAYVEGLAGPKPFDRAVDGHDYKVSEEAMMPNGSFDIAAPLDAGVTGAAEAYFVNGTKNIKASAVFDNLNDGDTSNDPFLVDVRKPEDYAAGHVPGAINMSAKALFAAENLAKLPTDQPIVVNCYSGQTASQVTSALNMLGYDASNLKFGFASWSPSGKYSFDVANTPNYRWQGTGEGAAPVVEEAPATVVEAPAVQEAPAALPATGGVPFDFTWVYLLVGSGLLGTGLYLRRS